MEINIRITIEKDKVVDVKVEKLEAELDEVCKNTFSEYSRFFDEGCPGWNKDSEYNLKYLKHHERYANDVLKSKGYLFLNDVYDMLGFPRTKVGQIVGWVYDKENPVGDNYVDFGLTRDSSKDFVNGYKTTVLLDFNVDGNILDLIEEEKLGS